MRKMIVVAALVAVLVLALALPTVAQETPGKGDPEQADPPAVANCTQQTDGDDVCTGATLFSPGKPVFAGRLETHNEEGYFEHRGIPSRSDYETGRPLQPGVNCFESGTARDIPCPSGGDA